MATLEELLKGNPYKDALIRVVNQAYDPNSRGLNPFEWVAMAYIVNQKAKTWGQDNNIISTPPAPFGPPCVKCYVQGTSGTEIYNKCCDGVTQDECCNRDPIITPNSVARVVNPPNPYNWLNELAADVGLDSPWTQLVTRFQRDVDNFNTSLNSAYTYFEAFRDQFYSIAQFDYFYTDYYNGRFKDFILDTFVGGNFRDGVITQGLELQTVQQGDSPTKGNTTMQVGTLITGLNLPFPAPYIATYRDPYTIDVFWMNENNFVQPEVEGGEGVTSVYYPVNGLGNNAINNAVIWKDAIDSADLGYSVGIFDQQLAIEPPVAGALPATLAALDSYALEGWIVNYLAGTGVGSLPAKTRIITQGTSTAESVDPGPYHAIYTSDTKRTIFWYRVGTSYIQPEVPIDPGYADIYYQIDLPEASTGPATALVIKNAIEGFGIADLGKASIENTNEVVIELAAEGPASKPSISSNFSVPGFEFGWDMIFTDGASGSATEEVVQIGYKYASPSFMGNKYFTLYDGTTSYMFYITINGNGEEPSVPADNKIAIDLDWATTTKEIKKSIEAAIIGTGVYELLPSNCDDPCSQVATLAAGDTVDYDGGTIEFGYTNQVTSIIDPYNQAVLDPGPYETDELYAAAWNGYVAAGAFSGPVNYLKSVDAGFRECCCGSGDCIWLSLYFDCPPCGGLSTNKTGIFIQTLYPAVTDDMAFNYPGNTFAVPEGKKYAKS